MFNPTAFPQKSEEILFKLSSPLHLELALPTPPPLGTRKPTLSAVLALKSRIYCAESRENFEASTVRGHRQTEHPRRSPWERRGLRGKATEPCWVFLSLLNPSLATVKLFSLVLKPGPQGTCETISQTAAPKAGRG